MEIRANKLIISFMIILIATLAYFIWPSDVKWQNSEESNDLSQQSVSTNQANVNEVSNKFKSTPDKFKTTPEGLISQPRMLSGSEIEKRDTMKQINAYYQSPGDVSLDTIVPYLDHADYQVVNNTLDLLTFMTKKGYQEEEVFNVLASLASDPAYKMRETAMIKGAMLGREEMLPIVASFIEEQNAKLNQEDRADAYEIASRALYAMRNQESVPYIKSLLDQIDEPEVRYTNYQTLASLKSPEAINLLLEYAESSQGQDQTDSVLALASTESVEALDFLNQAIEENLLSRETIASLAASPQAPEIFAANLNAPETTDETKFQLLNRLAKFAPNGNKASRSKMAEQMVDFVSKNDNLDLKLKAIHVIDELGTDTTVEILPPFFDAKEPELRREAVKIFSTYTNASNYKALENSLWDSDQETRRMAISAMGMYMSQQDIELLKKASAHEDKYIQQHASEILQQLEMTE